MLHPASQPRVCAEPCLVLCNHRCWADFFVDGFITGGAFYLSRASTTSPAPNSVGMALPLSLAPSSRCGREQEASRMVTRTETRSKTMFLVLTSTAAAAAAAARVAAMRWARHVAAQE